MSYDRKQVYFCRRTLLQRLIATNVASIYMQIYWNKIKPFFTY